MVNSNAKIMENDVAVALREQKARLVVRFLKGNEPDFLKKHTALMDDYFWSSFERSDVGPKLGINKNPYAIIALGGYGRAEQCIHSDVDILFLFEKRVPPEAEELIREMIYPLWDLGLEVGHATRSLSDCIRLAGEDLEVFTSLLDARFICGMSPIYMELMERLRKKVVVGQTQKVLGWLVQRSNERHELFGDSSNLLEPNLKDGQGGLRDYHTMMWLARIKSDLKTPRDLEYAGYLSQEEYVGLFEALTFIWYVRNRLHHLTGRKCDRLHFEYQTELAKVMKFRKKDGQKPVERFLGELQGKMEYVKQHHLMLLAELGYIKKLRFNRSMFKRSRVSGLEVARGMLNFVSSEEVARNPALLINIFEESARLKIPLSSEAKRIVAEFGHLADDFGRKGETVKAFERILVTKVPTFNVLLAMLNTGFLAHLIPEFSGIRNRIQYNQYHIHPVDKHSLKVVQTLKNFTAGAAEGGDPLQAELYDELAHKKLLLWAALLHDIGKGAPGEAHSKVGAEMAEKILTRAGITYKKIDTVTFLVENHLFLAKTATRRDINDEETAIFCARHIRDPKRLKMLYLLTVADSMATGPKAWNSWTATLFRDLFLKVLSILEKGELATNKAVKALAKKRERVLKSAVEPGAKKMLAGLYEKMSPRYLLYTPAADIIEHVKLHRQMRETGFAWKVARGGDNYSRKLTLCAMDKSGLFSKVAGVLSLNDLDILDVQVYTWTNGVALDIFNVAPARDQVFEEQRWQRVGAEMAAAVANGDDLPARFRKKSMERGLSAMSGLGNSVKVKVDNESSSFFSIVEVFTYDFPGLLFIITDTLYKCGLDVRIAKIATKVDQVVDVFYVRDLDGEKVDDPAVVAAIRKRLTEVIHDAMPEAV